MGYPTVTYTFTNATTASATQVNTNFSDLIAALSDGSKDIRVAALTANGAVALGDALSDTVTINGAIAASVLPKLAGTRPNLGATGGYTYGYIYLGYTGYAGVALSARNSVAYTMYLPTAQATADGQAMKYYSATGDMKFTDFSIELTSKNVFVGTASNATTQADTSKLGTIEASYTTLTFTAATNSGFLELTTSSAHGLSNGDRVMVSTSGALPTGLSVSTTYYVTQKGTSTVQLSAASTGSPIVYTDAGTGTHTLIMGGLKEKAALAVSKEFLRFSHIRAYGSSTQVWTGSLNALASDNNNVIVAAQNTAVLDSTSNSGFSWTARTSQFTADNIYGVAHNQSNLWVIVGAAGKISSSADVATWTARTSGVATALNSVAYGASLWVAVGDSGVILTSPDGITWTSRTSGVATTLYGVTYGSTPGVFVAVGNSDVILTSSDGITWTSRTSWTSGQNLRAVKYANGVFVAGGGNELLGSSTDGVTWTSRMSGSAYAIPRNGIATNGSVFVVGSTTGNVYISPNGIDWTQVAPWGAIANISTAWVYDTRGVWIGGAGTVGQYSMRIG